MTTSQERRPPSRRNATPSTGHGRHPRHRRRPATRPRGARALSTARLEKLTGPPPCSRARTSAARAASKAWAPRATGSTRWRRRRGAHRTRSIPARPRSAQPTWATARPAVEGQEENPPTAATTASDPAQAQLELERGVTMAPAPRSPSCRGPAQHPCLIGDRPTLHLYPLRPAARDAVAPRRREDLETGAIVNYNAASCSASKAVA